jgi:hypothetical protein
MNQGQPFNHLFIIIGRDPNRNTHAPQRTHTAARPPPRFPDDATDDNNDDDDAAPAPLPLPGLGTARPGGTPMPSNFPTREATPCVTSAPETAMERRCHAPLLGGVGWGGR